MYDYRRMTPDERAAIVEQRRSRGFPLHKPPHFEQGEGWYLITAATYEHRLHFVAPSELHALENRLLTAFAEATLPCAGWVVLPNHYHALLHTTNLAVVGRTIGRVHGRSSRYVNQRDKTPGRHVWYEYSDRMIRSERHFWASLHYIAYNPVKHGYVSEMGEWPWSCVHEMIADRGREWFHSLVNDYPLGEYGDKWDVYTG